MVTMTILFSLGSANYRDFSRARELEGWARKVEGDLRLAQQYASVGRKPAVGCNVLDGYEFEVNDASNPQDYTISPNCEGTALTAVKTVELPEHVSIIAPAINPILFKVLEQGTNLTTTTPSITVNVSAYGMFQGIIVTSGGEIYRGAAAAIPTPVAPTATPAPVPTSTPMPGPTPTSTLTPTPAPDCTDTDGGIDPYVVGTVTGLDGCSMTDSCHPNGKILRERYCGSGGKCRTKNIICACSGGKC